MKAKRFTTLLVSGVLAASMLVGCGGINKNATVATLDGQEIKLGGRSLSCCCLLFSCDPCPPKMTLTSLSTRGKAPPSPSSCYWGCRGSSGPPRGGGGRGWKGRPCPMECLKSLQFRRVWRMSLWYGHWWRTAYYNVNITFILFKY